jgi:hypothetical protein
MSFSYVYYKFFTRATDTTVIIIEWVNQKSAQIPRFLRKVIIIGNDKQFFTVYLLLMKGFVTNLFQLFAAVVYQYN